MRRSLPGFTLVELLAVIAILSLLISLLLPVLSSMRRKANDAACVGNLRTISSLVGLYLGDNDGYLPPRIQSRETGTQMRWSGLLGRYLLSGDDGPESKIQTSTAYRKTFYCPGCLDFHGRSLEDMRHHPGGFTTYAINEYFIGLNPSSPPLYGARKRVAIEPGRIEPYLVDGGSSEPSPDSVSMSFNNAEMNVISGPGGYHDRAAHALFIDGRVERLDAKQFQAIRAAVENRFDFQ